MSVLTTDGDMATLCAEIYQANAIVGSFDYFDAGMDDGVCWALKHFDGYDVVVFRGSITLQDWLRDLTAIAMPSRIGHVHTGFYAGMEHMWSDLKPILKQPAIVTGHSLGAARADVLAALMKVDGSPPVERIVFGEPKPGLLDFAALLDGMPGRSYRNGDATHHDLVTDLPLTFPPEEYVHPTPIIPVCAPPSGSQFAQLGVFAWHHVELYETALSTAQASQEKAA